MSDKSFNDCEIHAGGDIHIGDDVTTVTYDTTSFDRAVYKKNYYASRVGRLGSGGRIYFRKSLTDFLMVLAGAYLIIADFAPRGIYDEENVWLGLLNLSHVILELPCTVVSNLFGLVMLRWWISDDTAKIIQGILNHHSTLIVGTLLLVIFGVRLLYHLKWVRDCHHYQAFCKKQEDEADEELLR